MSRPVPAPDADSAAYWAGLADGQLLLQHCGACCAVQAYQQRTCRTCGSERLVHRPAAGGGTIHSFSVVHRAPDPAFAAEVPYAVLLVELDEGPRLITRAVDGTDPATVAIGCRVELRCVRQGEAVLPYFRFATAT